VIASCRVSYGSRSDSSPGRLLRSTGSCLPHRPDHATAVCFIGIHPRPDNHVADNKLDHRVQTGPESASTDAGSEEPPCPARASRRQPNNCDGCNADATRNCRDTRSRLHRLSHRSLLEIIGPTPPKLPRRALETFRNGLDHMKVSSSRDRRRHRNTQLVNSDYGIAEHALLTPDGVSLPLTLCVRRSFCDGH